jgi:hypothetical protein
MQGFRSAGQTEFRKPHTHLVIPKQQNVHFKDLDMGTLVVDTQSRSQMPDECKASSTHQSNEWNKKETAHHNLAEKNSTPDSVSYYLNTFVVPGVLHNIQVTSKVITHVTLLRDPHKIKE